MYECPGCGGNLKFDIPTQQLLCAYCGTKKNPYEVEKKTDAVEKDYFETTVFTCPQCGGELFSTDGEATSFCTFCGASNILTSRISKEKRPEYIIPFKQTKEDCKEAYAKKMRYAFFAPDELKKAEYIEEFRGIYMPYWTYQITQDKRMSLRGEQSHRSGDYIITDHYFLHGDLNAYYLGYSSDASASFYDGISEALAPYDVKKLVNFTPSFLSGFYAETADVPETVYESDMKELANRSTFEQIKNRPEFSGYKLDSCNKATGLNTNLGTTCREVDRTMYPVWFLTYRNKNRVAYATVNGQTGKVVADVPVDIRKYLLGSVLLAAVIFCFLNLFLTIKPTVLLSISVVLVVLSGFLYSRELKEIYRKETYSDDKGMRAVGKPMDERVGASTKRRTAKVRSKESISARLIMLAVFLPMVIGAGAMLGWPIIVVLTVIMTITGISNSNKVGGIRDSLGFIFSAVVVFTALIMKILNPVSDLYYYAMALLSLLAVLYNLYDLIRNYNRLAMRRLPQFDKKGGDHHA